MEREFVNLEREFKLAEKSYGTDHLDLVLTNGYLGKLLGDARVVRYLAQHHSDILTEFKSVLSWNLLRLEFVQAIAADRSEPLMGTRTR